MSCSSWLGVAGLVLASCKFPPPPDVDFEDGAVDAPGGADDARCEGDDFGFVVSNIAPCEIPAPTGALDLSDIVSIDTTSGTMTTRGNVTIPIPGSALRNQGNGTMVRVVAARSFTIPAGEGVRATGTYPLAFFIHGDVSILGALSVAAYGALPTPAPAGANSTCGLGSGSAGGGASSAYGGGGGGGAFGAAGGEGGNGNLQAGGAAGEPLTTPSHTPLRGGCAGSPGNAGATAGGGGGALQISAGGTIAIMGTVSASGGGGGSAPGSGGGGGGSGGMIVLESATSVTGTGQLTANGGGGGGGVGLIWVRTSAHTFNGTASPSLRTLPL